MRWLIWLTGMLLGSILLPLPALSQQLSGTVKDSTGVTLLGASVNLKKTAGVTIVAYATTDDKGGYLLNIPANMPAIGLYIEVRCIGYRTQIKSVGNPPAKMDFTLSQSVNELQAVVVHSKRPFLRANGDTLSYKVSDFSNPQDRVIGDVIKRLPGISVAEDGTISYNSKQVSAVYLGGDNLLDDRYNIATNSIPQGVVNQVQVIDNDQPIKVLQRKVTSNNVALNLTFKKTAKQQLFGQETFGGGLPDNYYFDLNAMLFNDRFKAINQLKGDNTGYDLQRDLVSHNLSDYRQLIGNDLPQPLLSLGAVNNPNLIRNRYLFNNGGVLNINDLVNLQKGWQLRVNAFYLHDSQKQDYSQHTSVFLPGDTIKYAEAQHNRFVPDLLHTQFSILHNTDKNYLNDVLQLDDNRTTGRSDLNSNGVPVSQLLADHSTNFSNEFNLITSNRSDHIIQLYSYISHLAEPERLTIASDYRPEIFNNGTPYVQLAQTVNVPTWYTNNYLSYKIPGELVTQSFRTGFSLQSQTLGSSLSPGSDTSANHLNWNKRKFYAEAAYDIPGEKFKANLTLPLSLQQISYSDSAFALRRKLTRLYFNPQVQLKYYTGAENFMTLMYNYRNQVGTIENVYQGDILKDYRTLYANSPELTLQQNQSAAVGFVYRKAMTLFFWSVNLSYNDNHANNIASAIITDNLERNILLPYPNNTNSWTASGTISKYSFVLATTFSGGLQWQSARSVLLQNNALLPFNITSTSAGFGADTKVNDQLNFSYKANLTQTDSHSAAETSAQHIDQLLQQLTVNFNLSALLQFKLSGEHYFTRQQGNPDLKYFFTDASAKYRFNKLKLDLELDADNFLNVKTYNNLYLSANTLTANSYTLPGRIILLKVLFNL
ncbi:MAG: hypothetical protein V4577_10225 [Bacteroidota bacterium]